MLGCALVSLLCSLAFVLAPVHRPHAVYSWPAASGDASPVAVPLMLLQPAAVHASVSCTAARNAEPGSVLISTTTLDPAPGREELDGLRVSVDNRGDLLVTTDRTDLTLQEVPTSGNCRWDLDSDSSSTVLSRDGQVVDERSGDLRPAVAGVFTAGSSADGLAVDVTADTVFQTSASLLKIVLAVLALLSLVTALVLLARGDRRAAPSPTDTDTDPDTGREPVVAHRSGSSASTAGAGGRSPTWGTGPLRWLVDTAVVVGLAVWTVIGPLTPDDGYIAGIIRSRDANGYVGDVYRWFNAPEAPFGWFYELMNGWSKISEATVWMRVPSSLLGVLTWFLLSRGLLPRLGSFARTPLFHLAAALTFAVWWLPINLGLRPEPWVAAGLVAVVVLVERGLARGRLLPVAVALVVAAATLAVTPTGAVAFLPPLAAAVPVLRLARRRTDVRLVALVAVALAAAATTVLLMFSDQSLAAIRLANSIRADLPGSVPWSQEPERWYLLLKADSGQGALARRVPVLLGLLAALGILLRRTRLPRPARDVTDRLVTTSALSLVVLLFTPTKWTMHFGAFAGTGTALVVVAVHLYATNREPAAERRSGAISASALTAATAGLAAVLLVAAQSYAGWNQWTWLSNAAIPWRNIPPQLFGVQFSMVFLVGSVLIAVVGATLVVLARSRGASEVRLPGARWLPSPGLVAMGVVLLTVVLQTGSFAKSSLALRDTYSLASDAVHTVQGSPCGLAEDLSVEPDPRVGLLEPTSARSAPDNGPVSDGFGDSGGADPVGPPLRMAGQELPGWSATGHRNGEGTGPATLTTEWFTLSKTLMPGQAPLVVTVTGDRGTGSNVVAEFGTVSADDEVIALGAVGVPEAGNAPAARDSRVDPAVVPAGAQVVRLIVTDGGADIDVPISVSRPRIPVTVPFQQVLDPATPALVDWPVAFVFPCQELAVQFGGLTDLPGWRIAPALPSDAGDIIVAEFVGGPYTAAYSLVDQDEMPVYQAARPLERPVSLFRWTPRVELEQPRTEVEERSVTGWAT
ncbi:arabinosyltransferase domain-containing protein [Modestobacter altitudinis]|uniref:arabinosyltransferase domain-containing protein n=1 Tax=Modestobacter altitudinis TaxID=2213158 RepID=UPI00110D1A74|nr:arabinosyltransferase domain-containing protein [Modestobacter altitudinis]